MLLLDEPLGALDLKLREGLQIELKGIQRDVGITFVYVTHDQEEALTMSDRIAVMNRGVSSRSTRPRRSTTARDRVRRRLHRRLQPDAGRRARRTATVEVRLDSGPTVRGGEACGRGAVQCRRAPGEARDRRQWRSRADGGRASKAWSKLPCTWDGDPDGRWLPGDITLTVLVPNTDEAERQRLPGAGAKVRLGWAPSTCT